MIICFEGMDIGGFGEFYGAGGSGSSENDEDGAYLGDGEAIGGAGLIDNGTQFHEHLMHLLCNNL